MKRNYAFFILFILISTNQAIKSQSLNLGFRIDPTILLVEQTNESSILFTPYGMYLTTIFEPVEWFGIEIRPGYIMGGDYTGFEIGAFAKFKILPSKFFLIAGLNNHSNNMQNAHNGGGSYEKNMLFKSFGIGYQTDSKLSVDLMYYWTSNKNYAYSRKTDWLTYSRIVDKQMNGIIKVGFSLAWDIL